MAAATGGTAGRSASADEETEGRGGVKTAPPRPREETVLIGDQGKTTIADVVVQKIAGLAAREINGVYSLGSGVARAFGAVMDRMPGSGTALAPGVNVEVGERQAAVDLNLVVEYGVEIGDLTKAIRRNVIGSLERMTGLEVTEVNISVDDVHLPGEDDNDDGETRVE